MSNDYRFLGSARPPSPAQLLEQCYAGAYHALENGDDTGAARVFGIMALLDPRDARSWIGLAVCKERGGDSLAASGLYRLGAIVARDKGFCHLGRARTLRKMGRQAAADAALDAAESSASDLRLLTAIAEERMSS
jgi:hypothetical protein